MADRTATAREISRAEPARADATRESARTEPPSSPIGFLTAYGVPPGVLLAANERAAAQGVSADVALLNGGQVEADFFYRALARHLGLRFVDEDVALAPQTQPNETVLAGVALLAPAPDAPHWLFAPTGRRLAELLTLRARGALPRARFAIATPAHLQRLVFAHAGARIAADAADQLRAQRPDLSAAAPAPRWFRLAMALFALVCGVGFVAGGPLWPLCSLLVGSIFSGAIVLRLFAAAQSCAPAEPAAPALPDHALPIYTVVLALHREAPVIDRLVAALDALDYPHGKLDIKFVVEADDLETRAALEAKNLPQRYQIVTAPQGAPRTKPRALNVALPLARGELLCVFDAEDHPAPDQLREAAARFHAAPDNLACLQGRLVIDNGADGPLARLFALEYATLFDVINPGLAAMDMPVPLGGTSNHFRVAALRAVGGWDAWNVTEDIDLGFRLARFGYGVRMIDAHTDEEAPAALGLWMRQRRRWYKGWMQTLIVHGRHPRRLMRDAGALRAIVMLLQTAGTLLGAMTGPAFFVIALRDALYGDLLDPATPLAWLASTCCCFVFVAGLAAMCGPAFIGARRRGLGAHALWLLALPLYALLQTVAAWWALVDLLRHPFHWLKTDHGLARTSRRALSQQARDAA